MISKQARPMYAGHAAAKELRARLDELLQDIPKMFAVVENRRVQLLVKEISERLDDHLLSIDGLIHSEYQMKSGTSQMKADGVWRSDDDGNKIYIDGSGARGGGPNGPIVGKRKPKPSPTDKKPSGSGSKKKEEPKKQPPEKPQPEPVKPAEATPKQSEKVESAATASKESPEKPKRKRSQPIPDKSKADPVMVSMEYSIAGNQPTVSKWNKSITAGEKKAVNDWTNESYGEMRKNIASGKLGDQEKQLLSALQKGGNVEATTYRALQFRDEKELSKFEKMIQSVGVGGEWSDPAPSSTSVDPRMSREFLSVKGNNVMLRMKTRTGTYVDDVSFRQGEREIVTRPGAKYKVTAMSKNQALRLPGDAAFTPTLFIEMEEI